MVSYKPLWKLLIDRDLTKTDLRRLTGISAQTITRMGKGEEVSLSLLDKICTALNCTFADIVEHIPATEGENKHD